MTSTLRRLAGPNLDCGDVRLAGPDFICAAHPAADKRAPATTGFFRTVLESYK